MVLMNMCTAFISQQPWLNSHHLTGTAVLAEIQYCYAVHLHLILPGFRQKTHVSVSQQMKGSAPVSIICSVEGLHLHRDTRCAAGPPECSHKDIHLCGAVRGADFDPLKAEYSWETSYWWRNNLQFLSSRCQEVAVSLSVVSPSSEGRFKEMAFCPVILAIVYWYSWGDCNDCGPLCLPQS